MKQKILLLGIFSALVINAAPFAAAQVPVSVSGDFLVNLSPEAPAPNDNVTATAVSYSFDISRAKIQWILNGKSIASGIGVKTVSFKVGPAGSLSALDVLISPDSGGNYKKIIEIRPLSIDLLVESSSYVPFWYKGAALASPASQIKVVALPNFVFEGKRLEPASLVYNWQINETVRGDLSGKGRQSLSYKMPGASGTEVRVSVEISSPAESLQSSAATVIKTENPEALFYERKNPEGLLTNITFLEKYVATVSVTDIEAVPFFIESANIDGVKFSWTVEGISVKRSSDLPNILEIKAASAAADSLISVSVSSIKNALSAISASFTFHAR